MSDFGFDAYALDDADPIGRPHPLEIARDLIATGRPRRALELLALHHEQLADDPEYLLLCSEAWWADGDVLRAQQALLGAVRLAPDDPRPLQCLGELLAERGEHDKAERMRAKARSLQAHAAGIDETRDAIEADTEDDLIALAERQERSGQLALTSRQLLLGAGGLAAVALLITGIARLTSPGKLASPARGFAPAAEASPRQGSGPATAALPSKSVAPAAQAIVPVAPAHEAVQEPEVMAPVDEVEQSAEVSALEPKLKPKPKSKPKSKPTPKAKPKANAPAAHRTKQPDDAMVRAELASMDPRQLTTRADGLYAQGHTGLAASYYRRALDIDPDYAPALVGIGQSILRAEKYSEAMKNATHALQLARGVDARPGLEAAAIYQVGRVHYERGDRDAARRLFRQSISLPGTPPEAWFYLGEALSSDNSPAAREAYEEYLELVPHGRLAGRARRAIQ